MSDQKPDFNQKLIDNLATAALREQRARRRWGVFFKLLFFGYLIGMTALYYVSAGQPSLTQLQDGGKYAAVIQINGFIGGDGPNSSANINRLLRSAFKDRNSKGVILEINSPGGSAVEANRIYKEIRRLRAEHADKPLIAVAGDFCASGGYFIAAAADEIYADPASIIGSIGVIFSGFGFVDAMEKLGVERRVQTAGSSKNILDPFLPQNALGSAVIRNILDDVHEVFKQAVQEGRGERLQDDYRIFTGTLFSGSDSAELGLIDGFNDTGSVARDILGVTEVVYYGEPDWWEDILGRISAALIPGSGVLALSAR